MIRAELTELLKSPHFKGSKRYPAFLSYVVEKTLEGRAEELKERILGIEVFHRPANYDTNSDTIVRVVAGEVRKRLALVYHESEVERAVRIILPSGSYVPEFFTTAAQASPTLSAFVETGLLEQQSSRVKREAPTAAFISLQTMFRYRRNTIAIMVLIVAFFSFFELLRVERRQNAVDLFWQPLRNSSPAIICPGALIPSSYTPSGMAIASRTDDYPFTSISTTIALAGLVNLFSERHIPYLIQPASSITLTNMSEHPVILIGAYNNEWTARIQNDLRYKFAPGMARQIYDQINPSTTWMRPASLPLRQEDDYGIVARFHSKLTGNMIIVIAGIGKNGTEAAAQFATSGDSLALLSQSQGDWVSKNMEIVLKVKVINGKNGTPSLETMYLW